VHLRETKNKSILGLWWLIHCGCGACGKGLHRPDRTLSAPSWWFRPRGRSGGGGSACRAARMGERHHNNW